MAKSTFATIGILAVLFMSFTIVSAAASTTTELGITMTVSETALTDVTTGETYDFTVTIENQNGTDYNVSFGTSGWTWDREGITVTDGGATQTFVGTLTISTTQSKSIIAKFHDMTDPTSELFDIKETVSLSYLPILGCIDPLANNTDPAANTDDGSCTYSPLSPGCTDPNANNTNTTPVTHDQSLCTFTPTPSASETLCESEGFTEHGDLEVADFDVNNNGEGKSDEWQYLDEIEIVVEIENTHSSEDIKDVEVRIAIYDRKITNNMTDISDYDVTSDFDFNDDVLKGIRTLKDDTKEEVTFLIDELPSDIDGTYYMYIMAYEDGNKEEQCESKSTRIDSNAYYFEFSVESVDYDESVIAKEETFATSINTYCGQQNLEISIPIYNLGDDKEEKVLVKIFSSELGIDEYKVINNLRDGNKEEVIFFIDIPEETSKEKYNLGISVHFDWDEDKDEDAQSSYDKRTLGTPIKLEILSCQGPAPTITADLDSETEIGKELTITATITNNGEDNDFIISASDFESWAELISVSPQTVSIDEGESEEVIITLMPTKAGTQSFKIDAIVDGEKTSQSVSLSIKGKESIFAGITNATLYTIIIIVAVLILIFLALIVRISRRSAKPQF